MPARTRTAPSISPRPFTFPSPCVPCPSRRASFLPTVPEATLPAATVSWVTPGAFRGRPRGRFGSEGLASSTRGLRGRPSVGAEAGTGGTANASQLTAPHGGARPGRVVLVRHQQRQGDGRGTGGAAPRHLAVVRLQADLIHSYSRADALRDGILIDVSATACEAGIRWPVALTCAAWGRCVSVPPGVECQDEAGTLQATFQVHAGAGAGRRAGQPARLDPRRSARGAQRAAAPLTDLALQRYPGSKGLGK
jgi:uncharacterized protein DUF6573